MSSVAIILYIIDQLFNWASVRYKDSAIYTYIIYLFDYNIDDLNLNIKVVLLLSSDFH